MANERLSARRQQIMNCLIEAVRERGYPPSMRELAEAVGLRSPSTVLFHLRVLEKAGLIERVPSLNRAVKPLLAAGGGSEVRYVPVLGAVPAGEPLLAAENIERRLPVPDGMFPGDKLFMLRVVGNSMIEAGILDQDLVVVNHQPTAQPGEVVVALLDDEATVKYFHPRKDAVELRPANAAMEPIVSTHVQVIGKVVGVIRALR